MFKTELEAELKRQEEAKRNAVSGRQSLETERVKLLTELENLANEVAQHGGSESVRKLLVRKEKRVTQLNELLAEAPHSQPALSDEEIDIFLKDKLSALSSNLAVERSVARKELIERVGTLTLFPILWEGKRAFELRGDLRLFLENESVMLRQTDECSTEHDSNSMKLDGLILVLNEKGQIAETVLPTRDCECEGVRQLLVA